MNHVLVALDLVRHRLDLFGVLVLSFAAGSAGGISRDVLLGATPPPAISDWRYIGVSHPAALVTFAWAPVIDRLRSSVLVLDAAGLALFAVSDALKATAVGLNPAASILLGVLTGVGGGMVRDVLVSEVPAVLRGELYASAALAGAATVVLARLLAVPTLIGAVAGAVLCFVLRYPAIRRGWRLPVAGILAARASGAATEDLRGAGLRSFFTLPSSRTAYLGDSPDQACATTSRRTS